MMDKNVQKFQYYIEKQNEMTSEEREKMLKKIN